MRRYLNVGLLNADSHIVIGAEPPSTSVAPQSERRKPTHRIRSTKGWAALNLQELWRYRDLLWILVERNIKVIYKQTVLGIAWVALQPLIAAAVLAVIAG